MFPYLFIDEYISSGICKNATNCQYTINNTNEEDNTDFNKNGISIIVLLIIIIILVFLFCCHRDRPIRRQTTRQITILPT